MCPRIENQSWTLSAGTKAGCEAGDGQARRRREVEALELESRYGQRRQDLLSLLDGLEDRIEPLQEAVRAAAQAHPQARLLMTHPGVGPVVSLASVLTIGDGQRFPRGKQVASYPGLIPCEEWCGDKNLETRQPDDFQR